MAQIEMDGVAHSYLRHPEKDADYAIKTIANIWDDGGAYALLGPSGCGKTTLLNIISGLLTPTRGRVLYNGTDVTALPPENPRRFYNVVLSRFVEKERIVTGGINVVAPPPEPLVLE